MFSLRSPGAGALLILGALVSCSGSFTGDGAAPSSAFDVRLLDDRGELEGAQVRGDPGGLCDGAPRAEPGSVVAECDFDGPPPASWFDGTWPRELRGAAATPRHARAKLERIGGSSVARLAEADGGLHRFVPADADAYLLVRARLRADAGAGGELVVLPHPRAAPADEALAAAMPGFEDADPASAHRASLAAAEGAADAAGFRDVELFLPPSPARRSISVSLLPTGGDLLVDRVEVRVLGVTDALARSPRLAFDLSQQPLRRVLPFVRSTLDALLLPAGVRVAFRVRVGERRPRLSFVPGALAVEAGIPCELRVRADGEELARRELRSLKLSDAHPDLTATVLDLARFAGREVTLEFSALAKGDVVAFAGAPALLATPDDPPGPNVLLISLDTLRADHLGCYGDPRGLSPNVDRLAAEGTRFARTWSPSSFTLPTHMSLFSGQHPLVHEKFDLEHRVDPDRTVLLSTRLRARGWRTAAFTGAGFVDPKLGFGAGFDRYGGDDPLGRTSRLRSGRAPAPAPAPTATDGDPTQPALDWLRANADLPFFCFVHTFLVHNYTPGRAWLARFADPDAKIADDAPLELRRRALAGDAAALARARALYAATVAEADERLVGRLLALLDELRLSGRTLVVLVSDHGEELLDHGAMGHARELYDESTRVACILRGPGVPRGSVCDDPVGLADVATTIARLTGLPPDPRVQAPDLFAPLGGEADAAQLLILEGAPGRRREALVTGGFKVMRWPEGSGEPAVRVFSLRDDPKERHDLSGEDPRRTRLLLRRLDQTRARILASAESLPQTDPGRARALTRQQIEELHALGYLEGR